MGKITQVVEWLERNRIIRKVAVIWIMILITYLAVATMQPEIIGSVSGSVATIVTAVIGIFSVVMKSLIQGDKEE